MSENTTSSSNSSPVSSNANSSNSATAQLTGATAQLTGATAQFPVSMTEKAAVQIRMIQEREDTIEKYLRVSVVGGGCSGLSYKLSFEDAPGEKDRVEEFFGIKVLADPKSLLFLKGTELDFTDGLDGQGFVFQNPNAKQACGCGSSFSA